ncbi:MAG: aspartate/glutamate racemase family protein [Rectinemataceae bacterium]
MNKEGENSACNQEIGILMLDTTFQRLPGDIGNPGTFNFPVRYCLVEGASPKRVVEEMDRTLLQPFIMAARKLQNEGVSAITTSCGFLVLFQRELADSVEVPLFTSSLLQIPFLYRLFGSRGKAGILTARAASLSAMHLRACEADSIPHEIAGMDDCPSFSRVFLERDGSSAEQTLDRAAIEEEIRSTASALVVAHPEIRFIVLECTNMVPFRSAIREVTERPIFDIVTLTRFVHAGLCWDWRG